MDRLRYYEELINKFLLAHDKDTEFFARYIPETKQWEDCNIPFSRFTHDYDYRAVSQEEAAQITGGNLADSVFKDYLMMINRNLSGPSNE